MSRKAPTPPPKGIKKPDPPPGPPILRWRMGRPPPGPPNIQQFREDHRERLRMGPSVDKDASDVMTVGNRSILIQNLGTKVLMYKDNEIQPGEDFEVTDRGDIDEILRRITGGF